MQDETISSGGSPGALAEIFRGTPIDCENFYRIFGKGFRFLLMRNLGPNEIEDHVHNCVVASIEALPTLREPEKFLSLVHTIVRRYIAGQIEIRAQERSRRRYPESLEFFSDERELNPEARLSHSEVLSCSRKVLAKLPAHEREILHRFYVLEQGIEQICSEMQVTLEQFRNLKHRAKQRFTINCAKLTSLPKRRQMGRIFEHRRCA